MGAFWSTLGSGLENYAVNRLKNSKLGGAVANAFQHHGPAMPGPSQGLDVKNVDGSQPPVTAFDPSTDPGVNGYDPDEAFGGGKIVTKPTQALLGESGPEIVVPLTSAPGQKVSPGMMPGMMGLGRMRSIQKPRIR